MARVTGRDLVIEYTEDAGTTWTWLAACVQTKSDSVSIDYADVTADCDDGDATFVETPLKVTRTLSVSGPIDDDYLMKHVMQAAASIGAISLRITRTSTSETVEADYLVTSFERSGETEGELTFSAELNMNGAPTFTAGS